MKKYDRPILCKNDIASLLEDKPQYRDYLFASGFLLTDDDKFDRSEYPFYGLWQYSKIGPYSVFVHPFEKYYIAHSINTDYVLIGHAYNPFRMIHDENELLRELVNAVDRSSFISQVNEWTGAFVLFVINKDKVEFLTDATTLKMCHVCIQNGHFYAAAHAQMLADLHGYTMTKYALKIRKTHMYNTGMRWLPGDTTAYERVKRIGPNLLYTYGNGILKEERIYPLVEHIEYSTEDEKDEAVIDINNVLRNGIQLCLKKWPRCALSLTGGMDSGAEFSCTYGFTDKLEIMSYDCKEQEKKDSDAASQRCKIIGVEHKQYHIPDDAQELLDYDILNKIIEHNTSYVKNLAPEEIRKIVYFHNLDNFDVELKAESAEIGRSFYDKKYGMKMPDRFSPLQVAILQTRFFFMPLLQRTTVKIYEEYLKRINLEGALFNYEHSDLLYWEYRIAAAMGVTAISMGAAHYQTFPYNNRMLLDMMLSFPHEDRVNDLPQKMLIHKNMPELDQKAIEVKNKYLGNGRMLAEKMFFRFKSIGL